MHHVIDIDNVSPQALLDHLFSDTYFLNDAIENLRPHFDAWDGGKDSAFDVKQLLEGLCDGIRNTIWDKKPWPKIRTWDVDEIGTVKLLLEDEVVLCHIHASLDELKKATDAILNAELDRRYCICVQWTEDGEIRAVTFDREGSLRTAPLDQGSLVHLVYGLILSKFERLGFEYTKWYKWDAIKCGGETYETIAETKTEGTLGYRRAIRDKVEYLIKDTWITEKELGKEEVDPSHIAVDTAMVKTPGSEGDEWEDTTGWLRSFLPEEVWNKRKEKNLVHRRYVIPAIAKKVPAGVKITVEDQRRQPLKETEFGESRQEVDNTNQPKASPNSKKRSWDSYVPETEHENHRHVHGRRSRRRWTRSHKPVTDSKPHHYSHSSRYRGERHRQYDSYAPKHQSERQEKRQRNE